ncbi:MAG: hypothetical protein WBO54_11320 [Thermoanaerobaculia bacterium]
MRRSVRWVGELAPQGLARLIRRQLRDSGNEFIETEGFLSQSPVVASRFLTMIWASPQRIDRLGHRLGITRRDYQFCHLVFPIAIASQIVVTPAA